VRTCAGRLAKFIDDHGRRLPPELQGQAAQSQVEVARFVSEVRTLLAAGKTVVLADAGDPTVYCPWSWVCRTLADVSPVVVPGLGAFNAGNAALQGGVTPCPGAVMITCGATLAPTDSDGRLQTTVVLFTHRLKFAEAIAKLSARYPADTPVAVVADASLPTEAVRRGTLATIAAVGESVGSSRYLIYVGDKLPSPTATAPGGTGRD
jgi:precorrin-4/cobalt-precorrin-4 C11-methyltransferase